MIVHAIRQFASLKRSSRSVLEVAVTINLDFFHVSLMNEDLLEFWTSAISIFT